MLLAQALGHCRRRPEQEVGAALRFRQRALLHREQEQRLVRGRAVLALCLLHAFFR